MILELQSSKRKTQPGSRVQLLQSLQKVMPRYSDICPGPLAHLVKDIKA